LQYGSSELFKQPGYEYLSEELVCFHILKILDKIES